MKKNSFRQSFSSRKFKMGGFQTLTMVIVVIVVIVLNLMVGKLNITVDLSSDKIFSLTDETKNMLSGLGDDISIYYMVQSGKEAAAVEKVLDEYDRFARIHIEKKDPVIYPNFAKDFTDDEIKDLFHGLDYSTYSQTNSLDAEGKITAAIMGVTSADTKKIYVLSGHGETELGEECSDILEKSNMATEVFDSSKADKVPEDCDILILNGPKYDLTKEEYDILSSYLQDGGKAMIYLNPEAESQPNFKKLLKDYGLDVVNGYIVDASQSMSANLPTILQPTMKEHDITADVQDGSVFQAISVGMTSDEKVRSTLKIETILQSSDSSFSRVDQKLKTVEKADSDISGPFITAAAVTDTYSEKKKGAGYATKLFVMGNCLNEYNQVFIGSNQYGNRTMLLNTLGWLAGSETNTLAIPVRSLDTETVRMEAGTIAFWIVFLVVLLPLCLLGIGFVIWYRRRKR